MIELTKLIPGLVDDLLAISEWPWFENDRSGFVYSANHGNAVCQMWSKSEEDFDNHDNHRIFIAQSPVRLAQLVVALVEEKADFLPYTTIQQILGSFNLDPSKYERLAARLKEAGS